MLNINALTDLYRHMEWADAEVWVRVLASEAWQKDAKLRDYLHHQHMVQRVFLRVWRGEPVEKSSPTFEDAQALMLWGRDYYGEAFAYLETVSDEKLSEPLPVPWASLIEQRIGRPAGITTLGETILQVTFHSLYHRGQINARLREAGEQPPLVDYIAWVWLGRTAARWPSVEP